MKFGEIEGLEGKIIKLVQSFVEDGIPTLHISFTDESSFTYRGAAVPKPRCLYFGVDGVKCPHLRYQTQCRFSVGFVFGFGDGVAGEGGSSSSPAPST